MEPMCTKQYTRWYERELVTPSYLFLLHLFFTIKLANSSKYLHDPIWKLSNLPFPFCFLLDKNG